eukprot:14561170-Ditylum_brightwellii.AAC.1
MQSIVKYKLVDTVEGKFNIVEVILKGDALMHWLKYKHKVITSSKTQTPCKHPAGDYMSVEVLYASNLKLTKKLKKYKSKDKCRSSYMSESLDSDSDFS